MFGVENRRGEESEKGDWDRDIVGICGMITWELGRRVSVVDEKRERREDMMRRDAILVIFV